MTGTTLYWVAMAVGAVIGAYRTGHRRDRYRTEQDAGALYDVMYGALGAGSGAVVGAVLALLVGFIADLI